jgi:hypothetical protein
MAKGPLPSGWTNKKVAIRLNVKDSGRFAGKVVEENEGGCVVEAEITEGDSPKPVTRRMFYPWTSVLAIELLEDPAEPRHARPMGPATETPEDSAP